LPPATNLQTRGITEEAATNATEDILGNIPTHSRSTICGDWNARVGNLHPKLGDTTITRLSEDEIVNKRAKWVLDTCESNNWHILNGIQPGQPARFTYE
jgi:hypothetical protein